MKNREQQETQTTDADLPVVDSIWRRTSTNEFVKVISTRADYRGAFVMYRNRRGGTFERPFGFWENNFAETDLALGADIPATRIPSNKRIKEFYKTK